jgi:hypothetical protein
VTATLRSRCGRVLAEVKDPLPVLPGHTELLRSVALDALTLLDAVEISADQNDYCVVCDCHPSHGHAEGCVVA